MAMNKFMHPRNPYKKRPDFKQLAIDFPEFRKFAKQDLSGKIQFNFKDQGAVWALTKCLLKRDFELNVDILPDRLVPTLPLRLNYLLWIEDLLSIYKPRNVFGIDIGTGASCIYPLLCAKNFGWNMLATEIDISSIKCALSNVENNYLSDKIKVQAVTEDVVLVGALDEETIYDFCVCNPPFFSDSDELIMEKNSRTENRAGPRNAPTGIPTELLTPGGELVFIARIISDSQVLKDKVRIYSAMVGKKSNLKHLKELVRECEDLSSMATTVFCQGRTTRWGLAWTFVPGLDLNQAPHASTKKKALSFAPFLHVFPVTEEHTLLSVKEKLLAIFEELNIETDYEETDEAVMVTLKTFENTWVNSRKRRRQQKLQQQQREQEGASGTKSSPENEGSSQVKNPVSSEIGAHHESTLEHMDVSGEVPSARNVGVETAEPSMKSGENMSEGSSRPTEKRPLELEELDGANKKQKLDQPNRAEYLVASLILKENADSSELVLEMYFIEGAGGKDSANQLLTCLKNRLGLLIVKKQ